MSPGDHILQFIGLGKMFPYENMFSFDFNQHSPRDIKCLIIGEGNLVLNISLDGT